MNSLLPAGCLWHASLFLNRFSCRAPMERGLCAPSYTRRENPRIPSVLVDQAVSVPADVSGRKDLFIL